MVLVLPRLHLEDVRDHAVDLDVSDEAGEEEVLEGVGVEGAEGGEEEEEAWEPVPLAGVPGGGVLPQLADHLVLQPLHGVVVCKSGVSGAFYLASQKVKALYPSKKITTENIFFVEIRLFCLYAAQVGVALWEQSG